ncbi:NOL1/NOP2/sun family protein [Mycobacterium xenopi 4042]|uniref:NOL1/NOP2/sun family protein n=1 Tax=Mycobacterium xenopi 4042 TaxID=1299334 RepID=X7YQF0_MYCXE|nr:NOL1/NOP2/sun family protein [Mycobacterium xenopi 4042]
MTAVEPAAHRAELVARNTRGSRWRWCGSTLGAAARPGLRPGPGRRAVHRPGALRRRPEARWRRQPTDIPALTKLQRELLDAAIALTRPAVWWCMRPAHRIWPKPSAWSPTRCAAPGARTGHPAVVRARRPAWDGPYVQLWPHRHGTDAMFAAALQVGPK